MAADQARRHRSDPGRAIPPADEQAGKHHNSALCHIATTLLTRIVACWRAGQPYDIRDLDGTPLTADQGRQIITQRYTVSANLRRPTANQQRRTADGPAKQGVAKRSINRPVHPDATTTAATPHPAKP